MIDEKIVPLGDKVVIQADEAPGVSKGGIIIPDGARGRPERGLVIASGPGREVNGTVVPTGLKSGDRVLFYKNAGIHVEVGGKKLMILPLNDVLATIKE